ncbi:insecticidal toxin complex protein TccC [Pseudomonas sp. IT-P44]|uniref:RHS repeat-associated core domain-containing protein n=1 Tax=Pseudomonas sp. IT-P44 TaxID=3026451 RepID=UPI0039E1987C
MNAHRHTPTVSVIDPRSLAIRNVGYCRHPDKPDADTRITRQIYEAAGRLVASWDPRLWGTAPQPNQATVYGLSGQPVLTKSADAGWQLSLLDHVGSLHSFWDGRGNQRQCEYDNQQRLLSVTEQAAQELPRVVERLTYGGSAPAFAVHNQCAKLIRHDNPASTRFVTDYGLAGSEMSENQCFLKDLEPPDWPSEFEARDALLEDQSFVTRHVFSPTGEIQRQTDAMGNDRTFAYDVAGRLSETWLLLAGEGRQLQQLVSDIRYNAHDQIESETAGNGVQTRAEYGADDGRLMRLVAAVGSQKSLQDLIYTYDAAGNIIKLEDKAQAVTWFNNQRIEPINRYCYDSLSQLVEAKGWEVASPSHGPELPDLLPTPLDPNQRRNYTQRFEYDAAGNLITRQHSGAPGFSMFTSARSNRSLAQRDDGSLSGEPEIESGFDACGNQLELQRGQTMTWDIRNQLSRVTLVKRDDDPDDYECYAYDRPGHRLRKVHFNQTSGRTGRTEVRYLPGLELHRQSDGEERHVISIEAGRCSVRALHWPEGTYADQLRYSLCNHLGSSTLELDHEAGMLTQEHYYPFGGTACWAGKNTLVAKYKTIRYSGKERDATGLYCYGYRYYAPWLQRWTSPDPAGHLDGPNRYAMVGNNPINFIDRFGLEGEQVQGTQMLGGVIIMVLFALIGAGSGGIDGNAQMGSSVGALVGGALFAIMRWHEHQQSRPEASAIKEEEKERNSGERFRRSVRELAKNANLTAGETGRFVDFAYGRRNVSNDFSLMLFDNRAGKIYGYAGPTATADQADQVLRSDNNPERGLRKIGHSTVLLRDKSRESSSTTSALTDPNQFDSGSFVPVSGRRKGRSTSQSGSGLAQLPNAASAPDQRWIIDTKEVDRILNDASDSDREIVESAISDLRAGRTKALHWHRHRGGLWSADLSGYHGSRGRGVYRLMLSHQGGLNYRVERVQNPH